MQIAAVAGIPIRLHWSFIGVFGGLAAWEGVRSGLAAIQQPGLVFVALFGSVVLHELGHAIVARRYGVSTAHITLFPFGGLAAMDRVPAEPIQELLVALAGPAVNYAVAAPLLALAWVFQSEPLAALCALNLVMGTFNLIPAYPMDGGRILRATLATHLGWVAASQLSIRLGSLFAVVFVAVGLATGTWSLALVGGFLLLVLRVERYRLAMMLAQIQLDAASAAPPAAVDPVPEAPSSIDLAETASEEDVMGHTHSP